MARFYYGNIISIIVFIFGNKNVTARYRLHLKIQYSKLIFSTMLVYAKSLCQLDK